jgi:hypothetical protein
MHEISKKELADYNAMLPEHRQDEVFTWGRHWFDIVKARIVIARAALPVKPFRVDDIIEAIGFNEEFDPEGLPISGVLDLHLLMFDIDVMEPVMFLKFQRIIRRKVVEFPLLIDGHHRLRKAGLVGLKRLPAYVIPQEFQQFIQLR